MHSMSMSNQRFSRLVMPRLQRALRIAMAFLAPKAPKCALCNYPHSLSLPFLENHITHFGRTPAGYRVTGNLIGCPTLLRRATLHKLATALGLAVEQLDF